MAGPVHVKLVSNARGRKDTRTMFIFIAVLFLLAAYLAESVDTSEDLVVQYYDRNISTIDLLMGLNMSYAQFDVRRIRCPFIKYSCESVCPLQNEEQERMYDKTCYCDKLCVELGDCCYDFFLRCASDTKMPTPSIPKQTCLKPISSGDHGYAMIGSCPSDNTDRSLESLCTAQSSTADLLGMLPVSDLQNKTLYKNVFCARCNHIRNKTFWKFSASCKGYTAIDLPKNKSRMLQFIIEKCEWHFKPPPEHQSQLKRCLAIKRTCPDSKLVERGPLLPDLCSFYAFPICGNIRSKNPHCMICNGKDIPPRSCPCRKQILKVPSSGILPLHILFDFSSNSHMMRVGDKKTVLKNKECDEGFVFDPFTEKCKQVHVPNIPGRILAEKTSIKSRENETNFKGVENGTYRKGNETYINCAFVEINSSSVTILSNGSIWIPLHKRVYSNESYVLRGSSLFLCVEFKQTQSTTGTFPSTRIEPNEIITYIGLVISMICLILLLGIYTALADLRTLPGKNLMSLSCAMLLYHIFFLLIGQTERPYLCMAVSVLLHYFLLSSFCWMGVMAFDAAKTFGAKGQISRSRSNNKYMKKAFLAYSTFAWTVPIVIVITCVGLAETDTVVIGYADHICWISNGKALLMVLGVPVALILMFNFVALSFTMVSIWKVQKTTRRVADQSNRTSLPILYIKLSSAMGLTWILGFIVPFAQVEFLTYVFVILNSLQGFFIFLAFVANKRTVHKLKAGWKARFRRLKNADDIITKSKQTQPRKISITSL